MRKGLSHPFQATSELSLLISSWVLKIVLSQLQNNTCHLYSMKPRTSKKLFSHFIDASCEKSCQMRARRKNAGRIPERVVCPRMYQASIATSTVIGGFPPNPHSALSVTDNATMARTVHIMFRYSSVSFCVGRIHATQFPNKVTLIVQATTMQKDLLRSWTLDNILNAFDLNIQIVREAGITARCTRND
jgi:hypothetical protein